MVKNDTEAEIQEFNEKGFVRISKRLLYYIRINNISDIKFFRPGSINPAGGTRSIRYSSSDIFGDHHAYCFDIKRKKEFVDFLVEKFFIANEHPDSGIRKVFTRILHQHRLHWEECTCGKKNKYDMEDIERD